MPESKQAVHRTGSYLSNSAYRKIKRVLSFRRREYFELFSRDLLRDFGAVLQHLKQYS